MSLGKQYKIGITKAAAEMLDGKMRYIAERLAGPETAQRWLVRLFEFFEDNLTSFPFKFPSYRVEQYGDKYRIVTFRNDVIIYEIAAQEQVVYIDLVCTKGRDLQHLLELGVSEM